MRYVLALVLAVAQVTSPNVSAADINNDREELILLPLAFRDVDEIPGAFGTRWSGQVWLENRNDFDVRLYNYCPQLCGGFAAGLAAVLYDPLGANGPEFGLLLYLRADEAKQLTFSNRIYERTLRSQPHGIDIPVVREGNFFTGEQTFLGVPAGDGVRLTVRAYDPWVHYPATSSRPSPPLDSVTVEVRDKDRRLVGATTLRPRVPSPGSFVDIHKPAFDVINDLAHAVPPLGQLEYVHIRVTPVPATAQYWAMVSVTDNETQAVSIITAQ